MAGILKKILIAVIIAVPSYADAGPEGTVLVLSRKIGTELDSLENIYFKVVPKITELQKAVFFLEDSSRMRCEMSYWREKQLRRRILYLSEKDFREKKTEIDLMPPMPHDWWYVHSGRKARDDNALLLSAIPPGQWIEIRTYEDNSYRGYLHKQSGSALTLRTGVFRPAFDVDQIRECYLLTERRPPARLERNIRVGFSAGLGALFWAGSSTHPGDLRFYSAFSFSLLSYFASKPLYTTALRLVPYKEKIPLQTIRK